MKFILTLITLTTLLLAAESSTNLYDTSSCYGEEEERWNMIVKKYPDDIAIQELHATWLGLCIKVQRHEINTAQSEIIFQRAKLRAVDQVGLKARNNHKKEL